MCHIFEENPFEKDTWISAISCTQLQCFCPINHKIPKYKSASEAQEFVARCRNAQAALMAGSGRAEF